VRIGYEEGLARRILAGADILAAPSRFEPCGLTQMYAMRYATIPVVRDVGGLRDSVIAYEPDGSTASAATGFMFSEPSLAGFAEALARACLHYRKPVAWRAMQLRAMQQDFRWTRSAQRYLALYEDLTGEHQALPAMSIRGERRTPRFKAAANS
jgi:starch synthase